MRFRNPEQAHQELLALYNNACTNIESFKNRQYLIIAAYLASFAWFFENLKHPNDFWLFYYVGLTILALICFLALMFLSDSINKHRQRIDKCCEQFSRRFKYARGKQPASKSDGGDYFVIALSILIIISPYIFAVMQYFS
jgi:hypothetical protein